MLNVHCDQGPGLHLMPTEASNTRGILIEEKSALRIFSITSKYNKGSKYDEIIYILLLRCFLAA